MTSTREGDAGVAVCFVAHSAYGALAGGSSGHIGGIERQQALTAKWLSQRGWRVSMITWDEGQPQGDVVDGVRVIRMCRADAGIKGLRFFYPKWTSLIRAMRQADADVYYQNCGEYVTGQVALWCRRYGRKFVYSVASDPDCDRRLPEMHTLRERVLYRYGLSRADRVIVQTRRQQALLREGFGLDSEVLPMPCPGPSNGEYKPLSSSNHKSARVLWVGRLCEAKNPCRFLDVAEACPDLSFDFVGPVCDTPYSQSVCARARRLPNVTVHGPVAREKVPEFYKRAACLCCTSNFEGFPNTFLEAWSHGLPVVSTFDPDDLIASHGLGAVTGDTEGLVHAVRSLLASPERWGRASANARQYYLENHTVDGAMERFKRVFLEALGQAPASVNAGCPG